MSDTVHIVERETVWMPPDTLGRQYPVKTTTREAGSNRLSQNETIIRQRDTVFVSEERASASEERGDVRGEEPAMGGSHRCGCRCFSDWCFCFCQAVE